MASSAFEPVIGLTSYLEPAKFLVWDTEAVLLHRVYVDCVVAAGGIPVLLPPVSDAYDRLVSTVDTSLPWASDTGGSSTGIPPAATTQST